MEFSSSANPGPRKDNTLNRYIFLTNKVEIDKTSYGKFVRFFVTLGL